MFSSKDIFFGSQSSGYRISKSLRFRQSVKAQMSRTFGTPSNSVIWTISLWLKRGVLSSANFIDVMSSSTDASAYYVDHGIQSDYLQFQYGKAGTSATNLTTAPVLRDVSGWYHVVFAVDLTQATASNRVRIYLNGVQLTVSGTQPTQNDTTWKFNQNSIVHYIAGENAAGSTTTNFDGYMAEYNFIDGYPTVGGTTYNATTWAALNVATLFTSYDTNGIIQPAKYSGTYGNNGFYLPFTNTTSTTTLGNDSSGNGNNWTPANISLTAGVTYDSMIDSPTNYSDGGTGVGNYCTINPTNGAASYHTVTNANLTFNGTNNTSVEEGLGTFSLNSGTWYFEVTVTNVGAGGWIGISTDNGVWRTASNAAATGYFYTNTGQKYINNSGTAYGASYTTGDVIGIAIDLSTPQITFYKNGSTQGNISIAALSYYPAIAFYGTSAVVNINFGQRPFTYSNYGVDRPASTFLAINTQNLTTPTITNGAQYMAAMTYAGDNASPRSLVMSSSNTGNNPAGATFQPDFVWIKDRTVAYAHMLFDIVRGAGSTKDLSSSSTGVEGQYGATYGYLSSFNASGFSVTIGSDAANFIVNKTGDSLVAWQWQAGGAPTVDNTAGAGNVPTAGSVKINGSNSTSALAGSIAATRLSANTSAGFSVVTYTGTGANATVGHGLGVAPSMVIVKSRSQSGFSWAVWHTSFGAASNTDYLLLDSATNKGGFGSVAFWNNTVPNSTTFSLGTYAGINNSTSTYVAYCFAPVAGYSAFGSYTGNGSADGPFIFTGFRPRWLMVKNTSTAATDWFIVDSSINTYNVVSALLVPNSSGAEVSSLTICDFLSNGFKFRDTNASRNASGSTYIYAAFAENPFKISRAR